MSYNTTHPAHLQNQPTTSKATSEEQHSQVLGGHHPDTYRPVLTQDEIRVLKECNMESFYYRCVPLSTLFSGLAYIAIKNGYLQKSVKYGYFPKVFLGALAGYIVGKVSYQSACAEKIMKLPNSILAEALRKRKGLSSFQENLQSEPGFSVTGSGYGMSPSETPKTSLFEERRPDLSEHEEGADSYAQVTESLSPYLQSESSEKKSYVTYDELRRENREDYMNKLTEKYKRQIPDPTESSGVPSSFPGSSSSPTFSDPPFSSGSFPDDSGGFHSVPKDSKSEPYFNPKRNKYGDLWDE